MALSFCTNRHVDVFERVPEKTSVDANKRVVFLNRNFLSQHNYMWKKQLDAWCMTSIVYKVKAVVPSLYVSFTIIHPLSCALRF